MPGILYPAYQKLYSALSSLDRFNKESDFFDNISCLDHFFSEYRNVTFAIQKAVNGTDKESIYIKNRDTFLTDHWFIDKRNETTKQQPFRLVKTITITFYFPYHGFTVGEKEYTVENDEPIEKIYDDIKKEFSEINEAEIFFSVAFSFHEANSDIDLFDKLSSGISAMRQFMDAMNEDIDEKCPLCEQLKERICKFVFPYLPRDYILVNDYVYYPQKNTFERADRFALLHSINVKQGRKIANHNPLTEITNREHLNYDSTSFGDFTLMHALIRAVQPQADIMPAIMIVFDDNTYNLDAFHATIKTTLYRKVNEAAQTIITHNVKEVCFVGLYSVLSYNRNIPVYSKDRVKMSTEDVLVCASVDSQLNEKEYVFDGKKMERPQYVAYVMKHELKHSLDISRINLFPIWNAFSEKKKNVDI